jgi:TonB family protein
MHECRVVNSTVFVLLIYAALTCLASAQRASAPRAIFAPQPEYSSEARAAKIEGICTLGAVVEKDGRPTGIHVIKSLSKGLDEKAIEALKRWRFQPPMREGKPVRVEISVDFDFHLYKN